MNRDGQDFERAVTTPSMRWPAAWQLQQLLPRLGIPGVAAISLLIACAGFYASVMLPMDARIDEVQDSVRAATERIGQAGKGGRRGALPVGEQLAEFYKLFPQQAQLTDTIGQVFEAARANGLVLLQGEYRVAEDQAGRLRRFQMLMPVKADYPRIRRFLATLAADVPTAALEHIQFERQKIGDLQVEATIKLALYLERES
jgi:hypothetical protein